jgi:hypothetical protein
MYLFWLNKTTKNVLESNFSPLILAMNVYVAASVLPIDVNEQ